MAADIRLVAHAAQADAHILALQGAGDAAPDAGLAGAGGPDKEQNGAGLLALEIHDGNLFHDTALDLLQAVMILVQDLFVLGGLDNRVQLLDRLLAALVLFLLEPESQQPVELDHQPDQRREQDGQEMYGARNTQRKAVRALFRADFRDGLPEDDDCDCDRKGRNPCIFFTENCHDRQ